MAECASEVGSKDVTHMFPGFTWRQFEAIGSVSGGSGKVRGSRRLNVSIGTFSKSMAYTDVFV